MYLRIIHRTSLSYSEEIFDTSMEVRLRPRDEGHQRCLAYTLQIEPEGPLRSFKDAYGNVVESYNHRTLHNRIQVEAHSIVSTNDGNDATEFAPLAASERWRLLRLDGPVSDLPWLSVAANDIRASIGDPSGADGVDLLSAITRFIDQNFTYTPNVTRVDTTVAELVELRQGVCQDFAHLWIALARVLQVPARYVSGYIWNHDSDRPQASHAWGEGWLPELGWVAFDPTNWREATHGRVGDQHVRIAVGRDYRDVPPTRGVYRGIAAEKLEVDVRVKQIPPDEISAAQRTFPSSQSPSARQLPVWSSVHTDR